MLITKEVDVKWANRTKSYYINKGYQFTKIGDIFKIKVKDLPIGSKTSVLIKCDNCDKELNVYWYSYLHNVTDDKKYYCKKCAIQLFSSKEMQKTKLNNSISFEKWCITNNRQDILNRWDYELNKCNPNEISYGTKKKHYLKCPRGIHKSELKTIADFTYGVEGSIACGICNSFAQWGVDNLGEDFLEKYWDYNKNTVNPWEIHCGTMKFDVYIICPYHGSYKTVCCEFIRGKRCPECRSSKGENKISEIFNINGFKKILQHEYDELNYEKQNFIYYIIQKEFDQLIGLGGNHLSYDFYLPKYNLLIEYQGEFHDGTAKHQTKGKFEYQQEHDRRKKEYALNHNINFLEIWYWDFDNIEEILDKELSKYHVKI